jgi:hypothetical protein
MKKQLYRFFWLIIFTSSLQLSAQSQNQQKADIAFVLRGFEGSCFFCDAESFDVQAKIITEELSKLSFGKIKSYEIFDLGIDDRSPINLQSIRDIEVLQASLDGWPDSKWDWLRERTDFWYVVPEAYRPIIEAAINWMEMTQNDFFTWGTETELGKEHYFTVQTNVQRMGSSAAADYLLGLKMPEDYDPEDYGVTMFILNSTSDNQIAGGGLAASLNYFGVEDAQGVPYTFNFPGNPYSASYVGATPFRSIFYSTAVHEAIHTFGMGTHDQGSIDLVTDYSVMFRANFTSLPTFPAWDRYYWTNWLPQSTITNDANEVTDLLNKVDPADAALKYILEVEPGDEQGRGGKYKELYNGKWYTYQVDARGTLTFLDTINNIQQKPKNYILAVPETIIEAEPVSFWVFSDGEYGLTYNWKKDGESILETQSNELKIDAASASDAGEYQVTISNELGTIETHSVNVQVVCAQPQAPVAAAVSYCLNEPTLALNAAGLEDHSLAWYATAESVEPLVAAPVPVSDQAGEYHFFVSQENDQGCESERIPVLVTIIPSPDAPIISTDANGAFVSNTDNNTWLLNGTPLMDTSAMIIPLETGTYTVFTSQMGCLSEASMGVDFVASNLLDLKPNERLHLFPNPFQEEVQFDFLLEKSQVLNVEIFDLKGAKVFRKTGLSTGERLDLSNLENGLYSVYLSIPKTSSRYLIKLVRVE